MRPDETDVFALRQPDQEVPFISGGYEVAWQARRAALGRGMPATIGGI